MRNRFARRCCLAHGVLFVTTLITLANVINTPPSLLIASLRSKEITYPLSDSVPIKGTFDSLQESSIIKPLLNINGDLRDRSSVNIDRSDNITADNSNIVNSTVENTTISPTNRTENTTTIGEIKVNTTLENKENQTVVPDVCQGLPVMDKDSYIDENDKWWLGMTSFKGNKVYI